MVVCFCLVSPLDPEQQEQEQEEQPEKLPDDNDPFYESWPWQQKHWGKIEEGEKVHQNKNMLRKNYLGRRKIVKF